MTEAELADHLSTLLGFNVEGDGCPVDTVEDEMSAGSFIEDHLPQIVSAEQFTDSLLGLSRSVDDIPTDKGLDGKRDAVQA